MVEYLDKIGLAYLWAKIKAYVGSREGIHVLTDVEGIAAVTTSPYYASRWTGSHSKITHLYTGLTITIKVPVAGNGTYGTVLNVNDLGEHPVCRNANTMISTAFPVDSMITLTYDAEQSASVYRNSTSAASVQGVWKIADYNSDTDTTGYIIRTNLSTLPVSGATYRYRLLFTSVDGYHWVPANTSTSTNDRDKRDVNQTPINPFGPIAYYSLTTVLSVGTNVGTTRQLQQYGLSLGYSFNRTGASLALTVSEPVYIKAAPQSDGSAIIDADIPYVQALPTTEDGKIYIFLGLAYSATNVEMRLEHPVYYFKDGAIRLWTNNVVPSAITNAEMDSVLEEETEEETIEETT